MMLYFYSMDTKLKLPNQNAPLITCIDKHNFVGTYPPTQEQLVFQFFGYHKYQQIQNYNLPLYNPSN